MFKSDKVHIRELVAAAALDVSAFNEAVREGRHVVVANTPAAAVIHADGWVSIVAAPNSHAATTIQVRAAAWLADYCP